MTITENNYRVGKIKQLIDLNSDKTNFELNFKVASKNNSQFYALVVNQRNLDSDSGLEYKHVTNGFITGNIVSDKNIYQSYSLILKSDDPCECSVSIDIKDIPANIPPPTPVEHFQQPPPHPNFQQPPSHPNFRQPPSHPNFQQPPSRKSQNSENPKQNTSLNKIKSNKKNDNNDNNYYKYLIIGIVIVGVIILIYNYSKTNSNCDESSNAPVASSTSLVVSEKISQPIIESIIPEISVPSNNDLIERINNLNLKNLEL